MSRTRPRALASSRASRASRARRTWAASRANSGVGLRSIGMQHGLVGGQHRQPARRLGRFQPPLDPIGLLGHAQPHQELGEFLDQAGVGHAEFQQVAGDLDGRGRHPRAVELIGPAKIGAFQEPMILGGRRLLVDQLGLLDGILVLLLLEHPLQLGEGGTRGRLSSGGSTRIVLLRHGRSHALPARSTTPPGTNPPEFSKNCAAMHLLRVKERRSLEWRRARGR